MKGWGAPTIHPNQKTDRPSNVLGTEDFPPENDVASSDFPETDVSRGFRDAMRVNENGERFFGVGPPYPSPGIVMKWVKYYYPDYELVPKMKLRRLKHIHRDLKRRDRPRSSDFSIPHFNHHPGQAHGPYSDFRPYPSNYVPPPIVMPTNPHLESSVVSPYFNYPPSYAYAYQQYPPGLYGWY